MKLNRKGYTLVELLVTIVITSLVVGLSVFGIVSLINNSEEKTKILSIDNIKEAARIYSAEVSSDSWKKTDSNYDAFCVTIGELMNKGLLDKDASINDGYTRDSFVAVKRDKVTLAIDNVLMISDDIDEEYNKVCTGQALEDEDYTKPRIKIATSYTDRIEIPFTSGDADSGIKNYSCLYGETSSNVNREGVIEGNTCILDGLKNNREYYVLLYMNTNNGSSILADGSNEYNTKDFKDITFESNGAEIIINYDDRNIYGGEGYHYFNTNTTGISVNTMLKQCNFNNNKFSDCTIRTENFAAGGWYNTTADKLIIGFPVEQSTNISINTKICDKSNNCHDNSETINVHNVKFYRNGASSIDGYTSEYVERSCFAIGDESCIITSPEITANTGYKAVGWNTSSSATTSSWNVGTTKNINSDLEYYAITEANSYYIDLNWDIDGSRNYNCPDTTNLKAGLRINGEDQEYVCDYYTEWPYGTSWEVYGLKLNETNIVYSASGTVGEGGTSINIPVNTLSIDVNDSTYGSVSSDSLYVKPGTTYTTSGATLTLSDGRTVTAIAKTVSGYTTSFSGWSSTSGTINSATSITANFTATASSTPVNYTRFTYNNSEEITVYHFNSVDSSNTYTFDKKNGLSSTGSVSGTVYTKDELALKNIHFTRYFGVPTTNCYYGASTSSGVKNTFSWCSDRTGVLLHNEISIWKTTASGWYYSKTYDCFVQSANLSTSKTASCNQ